MTKTITKTMLAGAVAGSLFLAAALPAAQAEDAPSAEAAVGLYSKYVWRGFELSQDSLVIQPSVSVSYKGFGVGLWGNLDTNQAGMASESFNWNETDLTLSYDGSFDKVGYSIGYIYYDVDSAEDTQELYASISLDVLLAPTLTLYKDIANFPGWYASLGIGYSVPLNDKTALDLGAQIGYANDDANYNALHDGLLSASITFPVNDMISITPEIYYSFPLSDDAEIALTNADGDDSFIYGGIAVSFAF